MPFGGPLVLIKGGGDLATGVAYRLWRAGIPVVVTELPEPLTVRRRAALSDAVAEGRTTVEGMTAIRAADAAAAAAALQRGEIPVLVDPEATARLTLRPQALVDAVMAKRNTGTRRTDAPVVVALGPGFLAGSDCHAVIETNRGHWLGRTLYHGSAEPDTGVAALRGGAAGTRLLRAPCAGRFRAERAIADRVRRAEAVAWVVPAAGPPQPVLAGCDGLVRGLLRDGYAVAAGCKVGDVDPAGEPAHCSTISDKALAVGGGALEAILHLGRFVRPL